VIFIVDLNRDLNRFKSMISIVWFKSCQPCLLFHFYLFRHWKHL